MANYTFVMSLIINLVLNQTKQPLVCYLHSSSNNLLQLQVVDALKQSMKNSCLFNLDDDELFVGSLNAIREMEQISE